MDPFVRSILSTLVGLPLGCTLVAFLTGLYSQAWGAGAFASVFAFVYGVLPALVVGAPLYSVLLRHGRANYLSTVCIGVLPGLALLAFEFSVAKFFLIYGASVAVCTHLVASTLFRKLPRRIEHPIFGEALLMVGKHGSYWEAEPEVGGKPFTVAIDVIEEQEPTEAQANFFRRFADNPDLAFQMASALLVPEYEKWVREPFPEDWHEGFAFTSMSVPLRGDDESPWDLSFECLKARGGHLFTCTFENGKPKELQVDG